MAILESITNRPKVYDLSKSSMLQAIHGIQPTFDTIPDLIAKQSLSDIREEVRIKQMRYVFIPKFSAPKAKKDTRLFTTQTKSRVIHKRSTTDTRVFSQASKIPFHQKAKAYQSFRGR